MEFVAFATAVVLALLTGCGAGLLLARHIIEKYRQRWLSASRLIEALDAENHDLLAEHYSYTLRGRNARDAGRQLGRPRRLTPGAKGIGMSAADAQRNLRDLNRIIREKQERRAG